MTTFISNLLLGLGVGGVIAALAVGVVVTHRASNVINFAHAALGAYLALFYYEFRQSGDVVQPLLLPFVPARFHLLDRPTMISALLVTLVISALVGLATYWLIFRPLRSAPPLARIVASLGLMIYLIGVMDVRFADAPTIDGPLPNGIVEFGGTFIPADRYLLAAIVVIAATVIAALSKFTNFGLATRANAENENGAVLLGISADKISALNWMLATLVAGGAMILAAPILNNLNPATTALLVVPALGAALLARFSSIGIAAAAGLGIGMLQSEIQAAQSEWDSLNGLGLAEGLPFLLVLLALTLRSDRIVGRGDLQMPRLPSAPDPTRTMWVTIIVVALGVVGLFTLGSEWRQAIILSAISGVMALSVIALTGFVGQISLATFALAGTAAFSMVKAGDLLGLGFPWTPILGTLVAVIVGTLAGLPAIRVRGLTLAIASLAAAVAVEQLLFKWDWLTGGIEGSRPDAPAVLGLDLQITASGANFPRKEFGILCLFALLFAMYVVVNLRRSSTGRQWLAVRANERAAEAIGISAPRVKLSANAVAAFLAGIAGTLTAYQHNIVSTTSFGAIKSLVLVAMTYLAGIAAPAAALLAGVLTEEGLLTVGMDQMNDDASQYQFAISGLFLIIAAIKLPSGGIGTSARAIKRAQKAKTP
ncbi:MAG: branched-chain amino acid transport system permease protein [Candidatus Aldehydirespiratoraceae bacterium]